MWKTISGMPVAVRDRVRSIFQHKPSTSKVLADSQTPGDDDARSHSSSGNDTGEKSSESFTLEEEVSTHEQDTDPFTAFEHEQLLRKWDRDLLEHQEPLLRKWGMIRQKALMQMGKSAGFLENAYKACRSCLVRLGIHKEARNLDAANHLDESIDPNTRYGSGEHYIEVVRGLTAKDAAIMKMRNRG